MTATARRFLFDLSFDGPMTEAATARRVADAAPPPPPAPTITDQQLAEARAAAFAEGRAAGLAEAEARRDAAVAEVLHRTASAAADLLAAREETARAIEAGAVDLMLSVARKVLPTMAKKAALDELSALARKCLDEAFEEPRLVVRVPDALFDDAKARLDAVAAAAGYAGKMIVFADETLDPLDARVEWADGGAERDLTRLWKEIDAAAVRAADLMTRGDER